MIQKIRYVIAIPFLVVAGIIAAASVCVFALARLIAEGPEGFTSSFSDLFGAFRRTTKKKHSPEEGAEVELLMSYRAKYKEGGDTVQLEEVEDKLFQLGVKVTDTAEGVFWEWRK